ncbi:UDP-glucose 4-epimerase [Pandoraea thiooxydans]|uniref:UDP-glucose 4-epimerase n=1 Tax=Pandoraea thiooxydans TaxID=445709 RepID=A0A0G3ETQ3_9BURK|nr:UDP-glucose 4-epimerase GalE [Pandoraea thiooxydans]AKJ68081.1 UDP-glucose 4-epimerase GalE [Pandoraea thiooxydans]APR95340.1 UDP-glucose 4-epimerase [Pandoraea thiooxydans]
MNTVSQRTILVTGGAGYIGSHTCVELLSRGDRVIVLDNLANSNPESIERVRRITGCEIELIVGDACSAEVMRQVFDAYPIDAAIHFAALKSLGESLSQPLAYYRNNLDSLLTLVETMSRRNVKTLVFSSSAAVYGIPASVPVDESFPLQAGTPYGRTKLMGEQILSDLAAADPQWRIGMLRYFNPVGAHESGLIGEDSADAPSNLMPYVAQVAAGRQPILRVFGGDYDTVDGTGVRDYIHVVDLARGHLAALDTLFGRPGGFTVNLGTGRGYSVLQMIAAFEQASGRRIPYEIVARRAGDVGACYADASAAARELGWRATLDIERMCADQWRWQSQNPSGFGQRKPPSAA